MELIDHTINWAKGEIAEATIMGIFGALLVTCSILLWKFGNTPNTKALFIPLLIVGLIPFIMGISGVISNKNRIPSYQKAWETDKQEFILSEKARVEGFDEIFKYSYPAAIIMVITGAILFFISSTPLWKSISLALMTLGLLAYFIDFFAAERADIYLNHIKKALN